MLAIKECERSLRKFKKADTLPHHPTKKTRNTTEHMKKLLSILAIVLVAFSSCHTQEKVVYFQDLAEVEKVATQPVQTITYVPGDKLSLVVSSSRTPELATQFNLPVVTMQAGTSRGASSNQIAYYTVDEQGNIDVPIIGKIHVEGLTRSQVAEKVQATIRNGHINDAIVTASSYDQFITILGEVANPGRINITSEHLTLLEALGLAGDLTIKGRRDRVLVMRQEGGETKSYYVDLRSKTLLNSPVYNLKQNDVVYVEPNNVRSGESTNNGNSVRSISTWLSVSSLLISLAVLIFK